MWGAAVAGSPITAAIKELVDVAVAAAADGIESVRAAADVGDGGLVLRAPAEIVKAEATNWADEAGLSALINSEEARDATLGDGLIDDTGSGEAGLWASVGAVLDHDASDGLLGGCFISDFETGEW